MAWVLEPNNELIIHGNDRNGARATLQCWILNTETDPAGGAAAAIANGVQGISEDHIASAEILRHATWDAVVVPTAGAYARASNKAALTFYAADGSKVIMQVPGPHETIFDDSTVTVDIADTAMSNFIAYVNANCLSEEGAAIKGLQRGIRRIPPRLKRQ